MTMAHNIAWGLVRNFFEQKRKPNPTVCSQHGNQRLKLNLQEEHLGVQ